MSADSEKPNIIGGNWMKYCTVAKSMGRSGPIWTSVVVCARVACALQPVRSIPVAIFLPSRCAERCAKDAFLTSFRATLRAQWLISLFLVLHAHWFSAPGVKKQTSTVSIEGFVETASRPPFKFKAAAVVSFSRRRDWSSEMHRHVFRMLQLASTRKIDRTVMAG